MTRPLAKLMFALIALTADSLSFAQDPMALAKGRACLACHASSSRLVGPSFKEIQERQARQRDGERGVASLAASIRQGSKGSWGSLPMPPNPQVSKAEALDMARWISAAKP